MSKITPESTLIDIIKSGNANIDWAIKYLSMARKMSFKVGNQVRFEGRWGKIITGTITKINNKSIKIKTVADGTWSVSPNLIELVK